MKRGLYWVAGAVLAALGAWALNGPSVEAAAGIKSEPSTAWIGSVSPYTLTDVLSGAGGAGETQWASNFTEPTAEQTSTTGPNVGRDAALERDLEVIVDRWFLEAMRLSGGKLEAAKTQISISVRDAQSGTIRVDLHAERSMRPASNMKLVTTAAAAALAGPDGRYETHFELSGSVHTGVLDGDLIVRGGADPVVRVDSRGRVEFFFTPLVEALLQLGIKRITGQVLLDEGDFLKPGAGPAWPSADQHWKDYCALAAGLTLNGGVLEARVTAGQIGTPAVVELHPLPTGLNERILVATKSGQLNDVRVGATARTVTVKGSIGAKTKQVDAAFRHPDPVGLFGAVLEAKLAEAGIAIDGGVVRRRGPPGGLLLITISSPIADSLIPINTHSSNGVADQLFFKLGHDFGGAGTRQGGQAAIELALKQLGVASQGLHQVDGSGLSRNNRITPSQLTALLHAALAGFDSGNRAAVQYKQSLAVMGKTGTLKGRMRGRAIVGHVFAKTGFLVGTSALSGLVVRADGHAWIVSIVVNYPAMGGLNLKVWKPMQEDIVQRLFKGQ